MVYRNGNNEKGGRKREEGNRNVKAWREKGKSRNTTPLLGLKTTQLHL